MGTFGDDMNAFGYSINVLTMFGMVLAIGILVDDAIVVENVERIMASEGLSPREATIKAMGLITGADYWHHRGADCGIHPDGIFGGAVGALIASFRWRWWRRWCSLPFLRYRSPPPCARPSPQAGGTGRTPWTDRLVRVVQPHVVALRSAMSAV